MTMITPARSGIPLSSLQALALPMPAQKMVPGQAATQAPAYTPPPQTTADRAAQKAGAQTKIDAQMIAQGYTRSNFEDLLPPGMEAERAYWAELGAEGGKAGAAASAAAQAAYDSYHLPPGTILISGNDIPGLDLGGKVLAVKLPNYGPDTRINLDDIIANIKQSPDGTISATKGYAAELMGKTPAMKKMDEFSGAAAEFMKFMEEAGKDPASFMRASILKSKGLTEDQLAAMSPDERQKIEDEIAALIKEKLKQAA